MTADEEVIFEAVEEHHSTVLDIQMYTRMEKVKVVDLLEGLVARGIVREARERRQSVTKGPELEPTPSFASNDLRPFPISFALLAFVLSE